MTCRNKLPEEAQDGRQLRRFVFLNPNLLKLKTFDVLLEADSSMRSSSGVALAKIGFKQDIECFEFEEVWIEKNKPA